MSFIYFLRFLFFLHKIRLHVFDVLNPGIVVIVNNVVQQDNVRHANVWASTFLVDAKVSFYGTVLFSCHHRIIVRKSREANI